MSRIFISPKHDDFAILTAGEEDEFYGWVPAEEFVAKQYAELAALRSEIANYETARQEDARRLEQITAEREAMREALVNYMIYDTCDGYEKLAERFGACEHPESSVWMEDWKNLVLREPAAAALKGGKG